MVKISRGNQKGRRPVGFKKSSSSPSSSSSIFTVRNLLIFLVFGQGLRMLLTMDLRGLDSEPTNGIADQLGNFRGSNNNKPKPNAAVKSKLEDHELMPEQHDNPSGDDDKSTEDPGRHEEEIEFPIIDKEQDPGGKTEQEKKTNSSVGDLNPIVLDKKGTGPTNVGYVKDFIHERANPAYKTMGAPSPDVTSDVAKMVNEKSVLPCLDEKTREMHARCLDHDTTLVAYNSEKFVRTWCDQEIKPGLAVHMTEHCDDPLARLFPSEVPPLNGEHMPPIVIKKSQTISAQELDLENVECDIPCEQEKGIQFGSDAGTNSEYFIDGEPWKIKMNDKRMDRTDYKNDQYYSGQSLMSAVPLFNFDPKVHSLRNRPAVDFDAAEKKAIYMGEGKCKGGKRSGYVKTIMAKITVDSFGTCDHNAEVPEGMTIDTPEGRIALAKNYRIVVALDGDSSKDHIPRSVWEAFLSGAVPVVLSAENIATRFPPKSFINVAMYHSTDDLVAHLEDVLSNKELWLSYQTWRDDEKAIEIVEKQNYFARTGNTCRLCRWAYAKKYGLGWDHTKQEVRPISKIPKDKLCTTPDHGLVSKPFSESWVAGGSDDRVFEEESDGESCSSLSTDGAISVGSFNGHRKVFHHDGVTDIFITEGMGEAADAEISLVLKFPGVRNPEGACFFNTHSLVSTAKGPGVSSASIQDDVVKVTVLADWDTTVKCAGEGIMEIKVDSKPISDKDAPRRIRVIIEEINPIFDKMTEFNPSHFGRLTTKDFIDPLGVYFVDS